MYSISFILKRDGEEIVTGFDTIFNHDEMIPKVEDVMYNLDIQDGDEVDIKINPIEMVNLKDG